MESLHFCELVMIRVGGGSPARLNLQAKALGSDVSDDRFSSYGSEFERAVERRKPVGLDDDFDSPRLAWDPPNESSLFQPDQHRIHRRGREVEKALEVGMAGSYPGSVAHHVFADEGKELPLLASGAARERSGWRFSPGDGSKPAKRRANGLSSGFNCRLHFHRSIGHEGLRFNNEAQLLVRIIQQRLRLLNGLVEMLGLIPRF